MITIQFYEPERATRVKGSSYEVALIKNAEYIPIIGDIVSFPNDTELVAGNVLACNYRVTHKNIYYTTYSTDVNIQYTVKYISRNQ